jgi:hypothetical protein
LPMFFNCSLFYVALLADVYRRGTQTYECPATKS